LIDAKEGPMRWFYLAVIVLFAAATIVFALQNFEIVTISFLGSNLRVPLALLVAVAYLLGAATGGSLFALLRRSYQGSRRSMMVSS
jgi:lipopolysaccharide assembly protein A